MIRDLLAEGWQGVTAHRVRSFLSALGILFGVAAIVAILSIGEGARREQERLIGQLGILNLIVRNTDFGEDRASEERARRASAGLSRRDVAALRAALPSASRVGAMRVVQIGDVVPRLPDGETVRVVGAGPHWLAAAPLVRVEGRGLDTKDEADAAAVCVLGSKARDLLFPGEPAVGRHVRAGDVWLRVVGVVEDPGTADGDNVQGVDLEDRSRDVLVPLTTALERFDRPAEAPELTEIVVSAARVEDVAGTADLTGRVLARLHRGADDTEVVVPLRLLQQSRAQQRVFSLVMGLIAGISLVVGGIGIVNIMLASVMERTREIGIRLAVGATPRDIQLLFLAESALISLVGGVAGIVAGVALAAGVGAFTGWATSIPPWSMALAAGLSMAEGLVFGWIPARNASRMSPATAIQYQG